MNVTMNPRQVTLLSVAINLGIGILKVVAGTLAHSRALVADGVHSLVDLSSDLAVLIGLKMAELPMDRNHLYGHHKFASFAQLLIALMIFIFSFSLVVNAVYDFQHMDTGAPGMSAVVIAVFGLIVKELLFWVTLKVAHQERSRLVMTNAWHHRTDSISSLLTLVAIATAVFGGPDWRFVDSLMAIGLGVFLSIEGIRMLLQGVNDLLDRAPGMELMDALREPILQTTGVWGYHRFRARRIGDMIEVDLHLQVDPEISVARGHEIAHEVRDRIIGKHREVLDVLVHIEPATEETLKPDLGIGDICSPHDK